MFDIRLEDLASAQAPAFLHTARSVAPLVWVPALDGWLVTGREEAVAVLRDATTFTVDDDRFSTAIVVGTSMLSTDGEEHGRHRAPFVAPFTGAAVNREHAARVIELSKQRVAALRSHGTAELRTELAGPLAVAVIMAALGFDDVNEADVLSWYRAIVDGVNKVSEGAAIEPATTAGVEALRAAVLNAGQRGNNVIASAATNLNDDELFSNTAVLMFGAIETSEGMTANALWHLLATPDLASKIRNDRTLVAALIDESLRVEPAAAVVDRYATADVTIAGAAISRGDFVRVSLTGANRDPAVFANPDLFNMDRSNARQHLAFVQGPHICLGLHLARAQTAAAITSVLDELDDLALAQPSTAPSGLIFRKPETLQARWTSPPSAPG